MVTTLGAAGLVAALVAGAVPAAADTTTTTGSDGTAAFLGGTLAVTGHGYGHGRGMSQYGARGAALDGLSASAILAFYYPNTTSHTSSANPTIRIRLDDRVAASGFRASATGSGVLHMIDTGDPTWSLDPTTAVRVVPLGGAQVVQVADASGSTWTAVRTLVGNAAITTSSGSIALTADDNSVRTYPGTITSTLSGGASAATVYAVDAMGLEEYVRGVVPSEMPTSWPTAAVQAQAVAARTYAAAEAASASSTSAWDVCSTAACQVYGGLGARTSAGDAAVDATAGQERYFASAPALTEFSSSNGGWTAAGPASRPYLSAQADPYEGDSKNPFATWTTTVTTSAIAAAWPALGTPLSATVLARDGNGADGGRVTSLELTGSASTIDVTGAAFTSAMHLKSSWFTLTGSGVAPRRARKHQLTWPWKTLPGVVG